MREGRILFVPGFVLTDKWRSSRVPPIESSFKNVWVRINRKYTGKPLRPFQRGILKERNLVSNTWFNQKLK